MKGIGRKQKVCNLVEDNSEKVEHVEAMKHLVQQLVVMENKNSGE